MYVKLWGRPEVTKYLNKYVLSGICLIYMSSVFFWILPLARKMRKTNMRYYQEYPSDYWHPFIKQRHVQTF
jgi:hypothetical protein